MVVEIINIKKCLVISDAIRKIAMRTGAIRTSNVHSVDAITALSLVHFYVRSRDQFAKLGGNASFYTYINQIFDDKCELVSKICSRRKVRRVQTYSLRNRLNLSLISQTERLQNLFAKFKTLCTFVSANVAISNIIRYILNRITAGFLRHYRTCCDIARLPKHKEPRFFCVHTLTNFCFSQWQTWTKVVFQRKALILLHSLHNRLNLSLISQTERSQSAYNHSLWTILKSSPRCSVSFL